MLISIQLKNVFHAFLQLKYAIIIMVIIIIIVTRNLNIADTHQRGEESSNFP